MTQLLLDFPIVATNVTHALLPDMSLACGEAFLPDGDTFTTGGDWTQVTCPWCHSLGRAWFWAVGSDVQRRPA